MQYYLFLFTTNIIDFNLVLKFMLIFYFYLLKKNTLLLNQKKSRFFWNPMYYSIGSNFLLLECTRRINQKKFFYLFKE